MWTDSLLIELKEVIMPKYKAEMLEFNNFMADNPELGGEEFKASKKYKEILQKYGYEVELPYIGLETAFRCSVNEGKEKKFALLCEYDALPDIGHACGHCASGVASLWAFLAIAEIADKLDVQVDLIGTPDEEVEGRKCLMAEKGVFDKYDFAVMCHMAPVSTLEVDFIALEGIIFEFKGKPAHAAQAPELGNNALNAARLFFDATDMMRQHIIPEARLHGFIESGGVAANIVPDYACVKYMVRAPMLKDMKDISDWVKDCARAAALATKTELVISKYGDVFYDYAMGPIKYEIMNYSCISAGVELYREKGSFVGSSDIGNVDYRCPAFHPAIGIGNKNVILHSHEFGKAMKDEGTYKGIEDAATVMLNMGFKIYGEEGCLDSLKKEFKALRGI